MKFSVIIPCGHVATTIGPCLKSVLAAADCVPNEVEIICVNGGCEEETRSIVSEFATKDARIVSKMDEPESVGVGAARNRGMALARGEYLFFVDADDTVMADAFQSLIGATADIVTYHLPKATVDLEHDIVERRHFFQILIGRLLVWNSIYRREMVADLRFPNISNHEDIVWAAAAFARARTLVSGVRPWYNYSFHNESSASNHHSWRRVEAAWKSTWLLADACRPCLCGLMMWLCLAKKMVLHLVFHCFAEIPLTIRSTMVKK